MEKFSDIQNNAREKILLANDLKSLENIRVEIFGKTGLIQNLMNQIGLQGENKKEFGKNVNDLKLELQKIFEEKKDFLNDKALNEKITLEKQDVTIPARKHALGKIHPITQALEEMTVIFAEYGFNIEEGFHIEDEWHNFSALNIPDNHPARQMHDTFYLENSKLLRTHTSPVQIRAMQAKAPPFRFIAPGRVYRCDSDATHTPMFHQMEGVVVDKNINMGHLKFTITNFIKKFFEKDNIEFLFRPTYFPFTEPSADVFVNYTRTKNEIILGKGENFLELLGCGMIHPNVLKNVGIDPNEYQGFAFGLGVDRFAMLKYGIPDLRDFFSGDIRWINHFGFGGFDIPSNIRGLSE